MSELKPCPFCGSKPDIYGALRGATEISCSGREHGKCPMIIGDTYPTRQEAIDAWNTRAAVDEPEPTAEGVADLLQDFMRYCEGVDEVHATEFSEWIASYVKERKPNLPTLTPERVRELADKLVEEYTDVPQSPYTDGIAIGAFKLAEIILNEM